MSLHIRKPVFPPTDPTPRLDKVIRACGSIAGFGFVAFLCFLVVR